MKKKILLPLTIICIIYLSAFTSPGEAKKNDADTNTAISRPTVAITYPSDFTRYLSMKFNKKNHGSTKQSQNVGPYFAYYWWDFNGGLGQQTDPSYYSKDGDQFPDCTAFSGSVYCEIRALTSYDDEDEPDLTSITGSRYRP